MAKKIILHNGLSPGDIVMLTAAVRELHHAYPGRFVTDVRTSCAELWLHNPHVAPIADDDPDAEHIQCDYPLINRANTAPFHAIHGFVQFLNARLGVAIEPRAFRGDIHLSRREKWWFSQVHEYAGCDLPFWILNAGGKYDVTIKWWSQERYQAVVDHFKDRILFVQIGQTGHHHPKLRGTLDLRGRTSLRELVRLIYHAQGIVCPVTAVMHLSAAIRPKAPRMQHRPCVVIAGAREPAHWEAYPGQQYIATNACVPCSGVGGCWKSRIRPLGDGDERDRESHLCGNRRGDLPACMDLISAADVIRRIETYFEGGVARYLTLSESRAARRGRAAAEPNTFDDQPIQLGSARLRLEEAVRGLPKAARKVRGRGVIICAGGYNYWPSAWVCIQTLRRLGCTLPIELWHLGATEVTPRMAALLGPLGVRCVNAQAVRKTHPIRRLGGWELKAYALVHSSWREVLFLDADNLPIRDPEYLFESEPFQKFGAIFWPDYADMEKSERIWKSAGLERGTEPEFESGQMLLDKQRCQNALELALWFNANSDFYYQHLHGDKETFHLAFRKLGQPYHLIGTPIKTLPGTMCQHDHMGKRIFQHRNLDKWNIFGDNARIRGFVHERFCRDALEALRQRWDGGLPRVLRTIPRRPSKPRQELRLVACMISCPARQAVREKTLRAFGETDWGPASLHVELDAEPGGTPEARQPANSFRALQHCLTHHTFDYLLFLEDDLEFNRHLRTNLLRWPILRNHQPALCGVYNPGLRAMAGHPDYRAIVVRPEHIYASQAFLISRKGVKHLLKRWDDCPGMQDIRISRIAGELDNAVWYHKPSLIQHTGTRSTWGGPFHRAIDFERAWLTPAD